MQFQNLDTDAGVAKLDAYLADKSYIEGFTPSQEDVQVFQQLKAPAAKYVNALRWYNHIASFKIAETLQFRGAAGAKPAQKPAAAPAKAAPKPAAKEEEGEDDDIDLFGSDEEEDAENERLKAERVAAYNAKKAAGKPKPTAKSMIVLDVKPWDDETDMEELKKNVLAISMEGLVWGTHKLVAVGYGIKKLAITAVVVDDLVGVDDLIDLITADEDHVQSVDIASFNKL